VKGGKKELDFREAGYIRRGGVLVLNPDFPGWYVNPVSNSYTYGTILRYIIINRSWFIL